MNFVKIGLLIFFPLICNLALAEYDKTYCGKFKRVQDVPEFKIYTKLNFNYLLDMTESCGLEDTTEVTYAAIAAHGDEIKQIEKIITTTKDTTFWCVKGRWSGYNPCRFISGENDTSTRTESINRIDRESAFAPTDFEL